MKNRGVQVTAPPRSKVANRVGTHSKQEYERECMCMHCESKRLISNCCSKNAKKITENRLNPWGSQSIVPSNGPLGKVEPKKHIHNFTFEVNANGFAFMAVNTSMGSVLSPSAITQAVNYQQGGLIAAHTNSAYPIDLFPNTNVLRPSTETTNVFCTQNPWPINPSGDGDDLYIQLVSIGLEISLFSVNNNQPVQGSMVIFQSRTNDQSSYEADVAGTGFDELSNHPDSEVFSFNNKDGYVYTTSWKYRGGSDSNAGYGMSELSTGAYNLSPHYWGGIGNILLAFQLNPGSKVRIKMTSNTQASGKLSGGSHDPIQSFSAFNQSNTLLNASTGSLTSKGQKRPESFTHRVLKEGLTFLADEAGGVLQNIVKDKGASALLSAFQYL